MRRVESGRSRFRVYQGRQRLFLVRFPDGSGMVRQRVSRSGSGPWGGTVPVFFFHRDTPLDPQLNFVENVTRVVSGNWDRHIAEAWDRALRTAR